MTAARETALDDARTIIMGKREDAYGTPENSFEAIAALWMAYLSHSGAAHDVSIAPHDVAAMMALLKIARVARDPGHRDSWVDLAGYAACGAEVAAAESDRYSEGTETP